MSMIMKVRLILICNPCGDFDILYTCIIVVEPNTKRPGRGNINKTTCSSKNPDEYDNEGKIYCNMTQCCPQKKKSRAVIILAPPKAPPISN